MRLCTAAGLTRALVLVDDHRHNGPCTPADEGLSYVRTESGARFLLKDAVGTAGAPDPDRDGDESRDGGWNRLCAFRQHGAHPHHLYQTDAQARRPQGQTRGLHFGRKTSKSKTIFPHLHGLEPGTTKADVRRCPRTGTRDTASSICRAPSSCSSTGGRSIPVLPRPACRHLRAAGRERRISSRLSRAAPSISLPFACAGQAQRSRFSSTCRVEANVDPSLRNTTVSAPAQPSSSDPRFREPGSVTVPAGTPRKN